MCSNIEQTMAWSQEASIKVITLGVNMHFMACLNIKLQNIPMQAQMLNCCSCVTVVLSHILTFA